MVPRTDPRPALRQRERFSHKLFAQVQAELTECFGGLTAHVRSPARRVWNAEGGDVSRDDVVILEVAADGLDRGWWDQYRRTVEARFRQEEMRVRALPIERLQQVFCILNVYPCT
jgi:hypothetical protein